jgi:hypothetical protein
LLGCINVFSLISILRRVYGFEAKKVLAGLLRAKRPIVHQSQVESEHTIYSIEEQQRTR